MESGEDELKAEYLCPFCSDDFDLVGLCCHIDDEHPVEVKTGVSAYLLFLISLTKLFRFSLYLLYFAVCKDLINR